MFKTFFVLVTVFSVGDASLFRKAHNVSSINETKTIAQHHALLRTSLSRFYKNQPETQWLTQNYTASLRREQEL